MSIDDYILAHIDPEPDYLHQLWRATHLHLNYPRMASGHLQGRLLKMLVHMIRPKMVLEIGTFTGYSALCMASALEPDAELHTIEINDEQEDFTRPWLENSPWADRIHFHIGDALEILKNNAQPTPHPKVPLAHGRGVRGEAWGQGERPGPFDLVFIDADKRHYCDYYRAVLPHLRPGGFIIADNTLWDGHVIDTTVTVPEGSVTVPESSPEGQRPLLNTKESQTQGILAFNDLVASDPAVERVILPLRDGLTLIRKLPSP